MEWRFIRLKNGSLVESFSVIINQISWENIWKIFHPKTASRYYLHNRLNQNTVSILKSIQEGIDQNIQQIPGKRFAANHIRMRYYGDLDGLRPPPVPGRYLIKGSKYRVDDLDIPFIPNKIHGLELPNPNRFITTDFTLKHSLTSSLRGVFNVVSHWLLNIERRLAHCAIYFRCENLNKTITKRSSWRTLVQRSRQGFTVRTGYFQR